MLFDSERRETIITKIPSTNQELQYYDIPTVQRKHLMQNEDIKKIRTRDEDVDDLDFNSDDFKISNDDKPAFLRRQMD